MNDEFSDEVARPVWVKDPETGNVLPVERDAEYQAAMAQFYAAECEHPNKIPMRVPIADGRTQVSLGCTVCGARIGSAMSQKDREWVESLPIIREEWADTYNSRRGEQRRDILLALARKQFAARGRFTNSYREYLRSPEWASRRAKVLKRCKGICEGCGDAAAEEVHHLSYRHFMNEFLFELVGLCEPCHDRWHIDGEEDRFRS